MNCKIDSFVFPVSELSSQGVGNSKNISTYKTKIAKHAQENLIPPSLNEQLYQDWFTFPDKCVLKYETHILVVTQFETSYELSYEPVPKGHPSKVQRNSAGDVFGFYDERGLKRLYIGTVMWTINMLDKDHHIRQVTREEQRYLLFHSDGKPLPRVNA